MRLAVLSLTILLSLLAYSCAEPDYSAYQSPNIILMLTDDQGWQDTSVPFWAETTPLNKRYHTPNLERLAAGGTKFTNAYANSVCTPTRVAIMTGLNAARSQVTNWIHNKDEATDREHPQLLIPSWSVNGLQPNPGLTNSLYARPLPQLLREAGYHTIHIGKGHLGARGTAGEDPQVFGFDIRIGGRFSGGAGSYHGTDGFSAGGRGKETPWRAWDLEQYHGQEIFLTEALTQEAIRVIRDAAIDPRPFFLCFAHYAPHAPIMPDRRFVQKYLDAGLDETEAAYASMIEGIDKSVGDLLDLLKGLMLDRHTIFIFMSDNGGLSHSKRSGDPHTHNAPLNSGKGSAYEGGIRVPLIVQWPGVTAPGSTSEVPVIAEDLFPTILAMAQVGVQGQQGAVYQNSGVRTLDGALDGKSFVPILQGHPSPDERTLYWHFPHAWGGLDSGRHTGPGIGATSTIRRGPWKMVYWHANQRKELFNLENDIGETNDVAKDNPSMVAQLSTALGGYLREIGAPMPASKRTGQAVPYPDE